MTRSSAGRRYSPCSRRDPTAVSPKSFRFPGSRGRWRVISTKRWASLQSPIGCSTARVALIHATALDLQRSYAGESRPSRSIPAPQDGLRLLLRFSWRREQALLAGYGAVPTKPNSTGDRWERKVSPVRGPFTLALGASVLPAMIGVLTGFGAWLIGDC